MASRTLVLRPMNDCVPVERPVVRPAVPLRQYRRRPARQYLHVRVDTILPVRRSRMSMKVHQARQQYAIRKLQHPRSRTPDLRARRHDPVPRYRNGPPARPSPHRRKIPAPPEQSGHRPAYPYSPSPLPRVSIRAKPTETQDNRQRPFQILPTFYAILSSPHSLPSPTPVNRTADRPPYTRLIFSSNGVICSTITAFRRPPPSTALIPGISSADPQPPLSPPHRPNTPQHPNRDGVWDSANHAR